MSIWARESEPGDPDVAVVEVYQGRLSGIQPAAFLLLLSGKNDESKIR